MEPETGGLLGAIIGAVTGIADDGGATRDVPIVEAPAEYQPLAISAAGQTMELGPASLSDVSLQLDPWPAILLEFRPRPAAMLASMTVRAVGQPMELSVCGELVMQPIIQETITRGAVQITGSDFSTEDLLRIAQRISGELPCDTAPPAAPGK